MKLFAITLPFLTLFAAGPAMAVDATEAGLAFCQRAPTFEVIDSCKSAVRSRRVISSKVVETCTRAPTWEIVINCIKAGAGRTNESAAEFCSRAPTWEILIRCMATIAEREYAAADISDCNQRPTWDAAIACYKNSGVAHRPNHPGPGRGNGLTPAVRDQIRGAIQKINEGAPSAAKQILEQLLINN